MPCSTNWRGSLGYARKDKNFQKELTAFLNERFIEDEDSAADFIARLEDAFGKEQDIGDCWHSYYVTDWDEVDSVSTKVLEDARRLLDMGNASATLQIAMRMFELTEDAKHHSLDMFDIYAHHLKSTHSDELLTEYVVMLKDYAARNMGAKHYSRIRKSMDAMLKLEHGKAAAHQLAEHFRVVYRRRPSFMAEISKF